MAPEIEVTDEQTNSIFQWKLAVKREYDVPFLLEREDNHVQVYKVDGEPFVFYKRGAYRTGGAYIPAREKWTLFCSDKHAKELEEAGIVNFSEVKEEAKQILR